MTRQKRFACLLDLDGTLNHAAPAPGGFRVRGRTTDSYLSASALDRLAALSGKIDIIAATGRSRRTAADFITGFERAGVRIAGWILEHGAVVAGRPEWTRTVVAGIDLEQVRRALRRIIRDRRLSIDDACYEKSHDHILLFSGNGALLAEHFIACAAGILGDDFRTIVGRRKIAVIPKRADKWAAFCANFEATHTAAFAAGDQPDDLTILKHAAFPLTHAGADRLVRRYVRSRKGFLAPCGGHPGTAALLDAILARVARQWMVSLPSGSASSGAVFPEDHVTPDLRIPVEEAEYFRPSKRAYLDCLFTKSADPETRPDPAFLNRLGRRLHGGRSLVLEVRMRDWGGEVKPLAALLAGMMPFLPEARWRLCFRKERRGVENLTDFSGVTRKLGDLARHPDGGCRLSAPGVPGSPPDPGPPRATLLLFDHPEDLGVWYETAMSRLITRHPDRPHLFWINPMYLKISGAALCENRIFGSFPEPSGAARGMMAANVIGDTDIRIAVSGFEALRDEVDRLIIAPRVVANPRRNRMIRAAVSAIGETAASLSTIGSADPSRIVVVDTYGDLPALYRHCRFTYLGGGWNPRKRGFDPVESLRVGVPVVMGPLHDYNRIAARMLVGTGWVTLLETPATAVADVADIVRRLMADPPDPAELERFFHKRSIDPLQVALEVMADLAGMRSRGYLLPENRLFARDRILPDALIPA